MRAEMLQWLHGGHQGNVKCRERARGSIWWPGIGKEIQELITACKSCQQAQPTQWREPLITTVHCQTARGREWRQTSVRWRCPNELLMDNGPQFSGRDFQQFAMEYDFIHITTSPHNPQANGEAEQAVQTAKKILK
ncbi:hypothetical protein AAFF_G00397200 [Aldrovandia affinis]|uniref:Gypsy retrotransposon integrase-like protein 1 n=1 Tax=Aldrovandia affinis TaxID=143900 RepID=A0AAD7SD08_9TELE|nr:hypothetical protein AAFF_G00397200 [Aldrovandia affinis]